MAGPYDYTIAGPQQGFLQGIQLGNMVLERRKQETERQKAEAALQRRQEVYATLGAGATFEDYTKAIQALPEEREAILKSMEGMDEAKKTVMFRAGSDAFGYLQEKDGKIDPEPAAARLEKSAQMFENSGDKETAQQLRDSAKALRLDPATGKRVLGTMLAATDPEKFKGIMSVNEGSDLTGFQKDLIAAGIDPNSAEGLKQAQDFLSARTAVEINVPGQGVFKGPLSEYKKLYGSDPSAPKAPPAIGEERNGYRFRGGNPGLQSNWEKVGGQSAKTGSFRNIDPIGEMSKIGLKPTSGYRTKAHQESLFAQGLTRTRIGPHRRGDALDFAVPRGMTKDEAIKMVMQRFPGARAAASNGNAIHVTFPGWGKAPDVSGSRRRFGE